MKLHQAVVKVMKDTVYLIDVCHSTKTIYVDEDMCDYDKLNDLPRIIKAFGCLYPKYKLIS